MSAAPATRPAHAHAQAEANERPEDLSVFKDGHDPTYHPDHPVNALGEWRKWAILLTLAFAGFLANFS